MYTRPGSLHGCIRTIRLPYEYNFMNSQFLRDLHVILECRALASILPLGLCTPPMVHHVRGTTMGIKFAHVALNGGTELWD